MITTLFSEERLQSWVQQFNKLTLREKRLFYLTLVFVGAGIVYGIWTSLYAPQLTEWETKSKQIEVELHHLNEEISVQKEKAKSNPNVQLNQQITSLYRKIKSEQEKIQSITGNFTSPSRMTQILVGLIDEDSTVEFDAVKVLRPERKELSAGEGEKTVTLYRHRWQWQISGSYDDIVKFIENAERNYQGVSWSSLTLETKNYPILSVMLEVYTFSSRPDAVAVTELGDAL